MGKAFSSKNEPFTLSNPGSACCSNTKKTPLSATMAKHLVAEKLGPTFGQGGDFTVVVEERQGAMAL